MTNKENAEILCRAIRNFAENPSALENFENYLSNHFDVWMEKYANTPDDLACEMIGFSEIKN